MAESVITEALTGALRDGGEALDRGHRGARHELALLRDAGLLTAPLPLDEGGRGWGTSPDGADAICALLMTLGSASLPIARLYEGHVNAVALIVRHGDVAQRARLAEAVRKGAMLGVWGADSEEPVLLAENADAATLSGIKAFASGLGDLDIAIVTARAEGGLQMVIVAADDPARADLSAWDVDGMVGSRSGRFDCAALPIAAEDLLGDPDALFAEPDFHGGVWRLVACYTGAMSRLAELGAEWLEQRGQHAAPLMQARLGAIAIEAETAKLWSWHAAHIVESGDAHAEDAVSAALLAREAVEQAAMRQIAIVERVFGTAMHRRGSEAGRIARDLRLYLRQADLDGKLALATSFWLNGHSSQ